MSAMHAFDLNDEQVSFLDVADRFSRERLWPLAARMDRDEWFPEDLFLQFGELGLLGVTVPEVYGGVGLDLLTAGLVLQGLARWNHAAALSWVAHDNLCLNNLYANGSDYLREKYLPGLCRGELIGALGLTEPGAGSDALGSMRTTARRDGDSFVLNGSKIYITNGPVADVLLVYARSPGSSGSEGISAFVVEKSFPGFSVAQKLEKMGFRGSPTGELVFNDCRVPARNLVGEEGQGKRVLMSGLDLERAMISPICLGISERAMQLSLDYARTRHQFGKPIASFQLIQARLADMYTCIETMRTFTYRALASASGLQHGEAGRGEIHKLTAASVMYAANTMNRVLDSALQIHGGSGYIRESEINRLYRATKLLEIGAGTTEVRQMIIAGELLKSS